MHDHNALNRTAEKIIGYVTEQTGHLNFAAIEDVYPIMRTIQDVFPEWVIHSCTFKHPHTRFVTDNCERILGYPAEELRDPHKCAGLFARIHEHDLKDVHDCFTYIENFLKDFAGYEYRQLRFVFQYRLQHRNGNYLTIRDEKATLSINESTIFYYCILKDLSNETIFTGVKLEIFKQADSFTKIAEYRPASERLKLSKRENELVGLMQRGHTTKEIASILNISQHTARNIRQKMFEKYKVSNAIELLNKTIYYN